MYRQRHNYIRISYNILIENTGVGNHGSFPFLPNVTSGFYFQSHFLSLSISSTAFNSHKEVTNKVVQTMTCHTYS